METTELQRMITEAVTNAVAPLQQRIDALRATPQLPQGGEDVPPQGDGDTEEEEFKKMLEEAKMYLRRRGKI
jgi:hypothetical protein